MPSSAERAAIGALLYGAMDFGFFAVAGPAVDRTLVLGSAYGWIFGLAAMVFAATLMPAGVLVRRRSPGWIQRAGTLVVWTGIALCCLAPGATMLLAGRATAGAGGAMVVTAAWATLAVSDQPRSFAASGGAVALGFAAGAMLGGVVAEVAGWRLALAALVIPLLPAIRRVHVPRPSRGQGLPGAWPLALAIASGGAGLLLAGPLPALSAALLFGSAVGAGLGARRGTRAGWMPAGRRTGAFCLLAAATTASGVGAIALLGRALADVGGLDPPAVALRLAVFGVAAPFGVKLAAALLGRRSPLVCGLVGLTAQVAAILLIAAAELRIWPTLAATALFGLGHVAANAGAARLALGGGGEAAGPVASLLAAAQYAGSGVGAVVVLGLAGDPPAAARGLLAAAALGAAGGLAAALLRPGRGRD